MSRFIRPLLVLLLAINFLSSAHAEAEFITLASTTSTQASGFFDYFLPLAQAKTGVEVRVIAVGTGQALKIGEKGDCDALLIHDRPGEMKFVNAGFGVDRRELMYNDFVFVGPKADPAGIKDNHDAAAVLHAIGAIKANFVSRADDSGTHRAEMRLWDAAHVDARAASGSWYKELGAGMGATLNTAAALDAYTLADRATWLTFKNRGDLELLAEGDPRLFNQYSAILVNPRRHPHVKFEAAKKFVDFLTSAEGQQLIGAYKVADTVLFVPNYDRSKP
ncbi:MAG: substrate-binding domain-containing protein [Gammaproteobacteria bacterium]|nr:substrate-binding domain-containing protein [Gammaproteobacteria bacterium]